MSHLGEFLLRPTVVLGFVLALAIANLWRRRRETRRRLLAVAIPFLLLALLSCPALAYLALGTLEWPYDRPASVPDHPEALVVLSGIIYGTGEGDPVDLGSDTYARCARTLELYHKAGSCLVLVCGGRSPGAPQGPMLADAMHDFLRDRGVRPADLLVENKSETTYQNAANSAPMLRACGIRRIVLVTDAKHMWRAEGCFRSEGFEVIPAPCNFFTSRFRNSWDDYFPSPNGAARFQEAVHEWLGIVYYRLRGWI
jgi:uncharacterized SAM-binding protein YcdF (DUF218 family)